MKPRKKAARRLAFVHHGQLCHGCVSAARTTGCRQQYTGCLRLGLMYADRRATAST